MSTKQAPSTSSTNEAETRALAYLLWESAGRPPGQDVFFWLEGERQLLKQNPVPIRARDGKSAAKGNGQARRRAQPTAKKAAHGNSAARRRAEPAAKKASRVQ